MPRLVLVLAILTALAGPGVAPALDDVVVTSAGTIGPVDGHTFRIGRTVERQVLRAEGRPDDGRALQVVGGNGNIVGRRLRYTLRTGKRSTCYRHYDFTSLRGKTLQDFRSNCTHLKTDHGTRVGMTAERAIANEGREPENPPPPFGQAERCALIDAWGISVPDGARHLVVWLRTKPYFDFNPPDYRNVTDIAVYGPKSPALEATCKGRAMAAARPTLRVAPTAVRPGGRVTFTGAHWPSRRVVELLIGPPRSEADQFSWARTGAEGRFRKPVRLSPDARPGRYVVLACRRSCRVKASARLTILP